MNVSTSGLEDVKETKTGLTRRSSVKLFAYRKLNQDYSFSDDTSHLATHSVSCKLHNFYFGFATR